MEHGDAPQGADQAPLEPGRKQDRRRLPDELRGLLPKELEHGLDHVVRRRILRSLHARKGVEASPVSLSRDELADESLSGISYHCQVLLTCEMVEIARVETARASLRHIYASLVAADCRVLSMLVQTEKLDEPKRGGLA